MALETIDSNGIRHIRKTVTIRRPQDELYTMWRHVENFPLFMTHVESVVIVDDRHSHWQVRSVGGTMMEWVAEIIEDVPGERIAWRATAGADVANGGVVTFKPAPANRGTEVTVALHYEPPAGRAGTMVAKMFGEEPSQQLDDDLYRFKMLTETDRIPTTEGQPAGAGQ